MLGLIGRPVSTKQAPRPAAGSPRTEPVPSRAAPPPGQKGKDRLSTDSIKHTYQIKLRKNTSLYTSQYLYSNSDNSELRKKHLEEQKSGFPSVM